MASNHSISMSAPPSNAAMPEWGYTAASSVLGLIGILGFAFNFFAIVIMFKNKKMWNRLDIIVVYLVFGDFSVATLGTPFPFIASIYREWIFGDRMCVIYGFIMAISGINSITTLTALAFERYITIISSFSTGSRKISTSSTIALILIYSFAVTSPPLFGWGEYKNEAANISCSVNWEIQSSNAESYIIFLFIFGLVLPMVVIMYCYTNIFITMREKKRDTKFRGQIVRAENRVNRMIILMVSAFLFAWMPYAVFALVEQFGDPELITPALAVIPSLIAKSSILYNPIIYVAMNSRYRKAAFKKFHRRDNLSQVGMKTTVVNFHRETTAQEQKVANYRKIIKVDVHKEEKGKD